jgi:diacylglycerol kinase (ATP)
MVSKKLTFIVNPNAAMGAVSKEWPRIEALAKDRLGSFETLPTTAPGDAINLTRQALLEGTEIVVCIGGDGTLNEVVNGFMGEGSPIRRDAVLAFIPMGTGCDFVKTVPIPRGANGVFDLILDSCSRAIDLGLLRYRDHLGRPGYRYFHNLTSFGLGGEVDKRVNRTTKALGGFVSFIWATLISLLIYDKKRVHLTVDNSLDQEVITWNIAVANGQYHGGGMRVAPDASVDDGLFHITVIGDLSLPQVFLNLPKLYNGKILEVKKVFTLTGKRIEAHSDQQVLLDVDGEQPGQLPVSIQIVPGALNLVAPS